jgi:hypothetical protein
MLLHRFPETFEEQTPSERGRNMRLRSMPLYVSFVKPALLLIVFLLPAVPANAEETPSTIESELETTLKRIVDNCKAATDSDACILEKLEKKRRFYEAFLDKTAPAAWPNADIIPFIFFYVTQHLAKEQIRCNSLEASVKQSCLEQAPMFISDAREEARHLLISKGEAYGKRQAAERNIRDLQQREHEMELARMQAVGQALLGLGVGGGLFKNPVPLPGPTYQPSPLPILPLPQPRTAVPPVSCSNRQVGSVVHTDC